MEVDDERDFEDDRVAQGGEGEVELGDIDEITSSDEEKYQCWS